MNNRIVVIGAGGHAKVVADAILQQGSYQLAGFTDATVVEGTEIFQGHKVLVSQTDIEKLVGKADYFIVAVGNNRVRKQLFEMAQQYFKPAIIVHPAAYVAADVILESGTVVLAHAVINSSCRIAENCIINSGVVVDHDSQVGSHVHLSIGTMVGSNSSIGDYYTSAIGAPIASFSKID